VFDINCHSLFYYKINFVVQIVEHVFPNITAGSSPGPVQTNHADNEKKERKSSAGRGYELCTSQAKYLPP
jgi:hypothetical protein